MGLLVFPNSYDGGMVNVNYGFPKRGGGGLVQFCFERACCAGISVSNFMTVWGFHDFLYGFFSSGIGWSRIFCFVGGGKRKRKWEERK